MVARLCQCLYTYLHGFYHWSQPHGSDCGPQTVVTVCPSWVQVEPYCPSEHYLTTHAHNGHDSHEALHHALALAPKRTWNVDHWHYESSHMPEGDSLLNADIEQSLAARVHRVRTAS